MQAFQLVSTCRRLPALLEAFLGESSPSKNYLPDLMGYAEEMRRCQHMITSDIRDYMEDHKVRLLITPLPEVARDLSDATEGKGWIRRDEGPDIPSGGLVQRMVSSNRARLLFCFPISGPSLT